MLFMNQWEIEEAKSRFATHPVLSKATRVLYDLMVLTNEVSDGWCYWPKPCRAAKKLQELIQRGQTFRGPDVTEAELKAALPPIKSLLTRHTKEFARADFKLTFPA